MTSRGDVMKKRATGALPQHRSTAHRQIGIRFQADDQYLSLQDDLSAVVLAPEGHLWLASDELVSLERLRWDGKKFVGHESFDLTPFFDLPTGPQNEIDIEGLSVDEEYLWLTGSH